MKKKLKASPPNKGNVLENSLSHPSLALPQGAIVLQSAERTLFLGDVTCSHATLHANGYGEIGIK